MEEKLEQTRRPQNELIKIVLYGPESTGKTTLAKQLADHYKTSWVPEYMREYLQEKWDTEKKICTKEDLLPIARGQMQAENKIASEVEKYLFCDTNLLEIKVYSQYYFNGFCPELIEKYALKNTYDIYLLTYIDTPWEFDELRDRPDDRKKMFLIFEEELKKQKLPFYKIEGTGISRFDNAVKLIDQMFNTTEC